MKTDEELKAEFLAKRGATACKPYDARNVSYKSHPLNQHMADFQSGAKVTGAIQRGVVSQKQEEICDG